MIGEFKKEEYFLYLGGENVYLKYIYFKTDSMIDLFNVFTRENLSFNTFLLSP